MIRPRHLIGTAVLAGAFTAPGCMSVASAVPNCGGQNAAPQPVPYECVLPYKLIDGSQFAAGVKADGTTVTVGFQLKAPRAVDTPIRIVHHDGISGAGGPESEAAGIIPAGKLVAVLSVTDPCRDGQLDIKAVFTANGAANGRIGGPWIQNGTNCTVIPTTTSPTTVPPSSSTTVPSATSTIPGSTAPVESSAPTSPSSSTVAGGTTLPATGRDALSTICIGFTAGAIGWSLVLLARRRSA